MKLLVLSLLVLGSASQPAMAQETFAVGSVINDQNKRVDAAYEQYTSLCFEDASTETAGAGVTTCDAAKGEYLLEADILVRLIHGNPPLANCETATKTKTEAD